MLFKQGDYKVGPFTVHGAEVLPVGTEVVVPESMVFDNGDCYVQRCTSHLLLYY